MNYAILLDKSANFREVQSEEQTRFIISILDTLEIPFEWDLESEFTVFDKIRLKKTLAQYNIVIADDMDGGVKIYLENKAIAEFYKPTYLLKEDLSQVEKSQRIYIEMNIKTWSIFEEANQEATG